MSNLKRIGIVVIMLIMLIGIASIVKATDTNTFTNIPDDSLGNRVNNNTANNAVNNTQNTSSLNNLLNTTNTNSNTSSAYNNTSLPHAGSSDGIAVLAVVAVFGVSALYAYKKIRDYNIK